MSAEPPLACSLSATELPVRLADMADLGRAALLDVSHDELRAVLRFAAGDGVHERVQAIADAESSCCAFLTMRVGAVADSVVLSIEAPEGADVILAEFVDAFRGQPQAT